MTTQRYACVDILMVTGVSNINFKRLNTSSGDTVLRKWTKARNVCLDAVTVCSRKDINQVNYIFIVSNFGLIGGMGAEVISFCSRLLQGSGVAL